MRPRSLVQQLLSATLALLLVLWIAMVVSVAWVIKHETDEIFDASLQETAQRLLPLAIMQLTSHAQDDHHTLETDEETLEPAHHEEYMVYQVFDATGRLLLRSHAAPVRPLTPRLQAGFQRTADHLIYVEQSRNGKFLLALAEKSRHRTDTLLSTLKFLLMPLLALLPLAALGMLLIVRKAGHSLQQLDDELSHRSGADLHPIAPTDLPQELQPLANTVNQLMHRLQLALDAERQFTANSAHELRTPLAAAMVQLKVLEQALSTDAQLQRLQTVRQLLQRLQNLSEKLLQLARAEAGIAWKNTGVDLCQLLQLLCQDHQWRADMHLHLQLPPTPVIVQGDVDALGIALGNLLENAVKYATPGSPVHIELDSDPVQVRILNDCEPLPATALGHLHERFYRARPDSRGAGLGLSIVHALLKQGDVRLSLHSPAPGKDRGFEARLTWA